MGYMQVIDNAIYNKLFDLHTAFLAKVISATDTTATVQPLGMIKQYGKTAQSQAVLSNLPIAAYKIGTRNITYVSDISTSKSNGYITSVTPKTTTEEVLELQPIAEGDLVICVCCDRDITDAKRGINGTPAIGHHSLSDSVIVGVL